MTQTHGSRVVPDFRMNQLWYAQATSVIVTERGGDEYAAYRSSQLCSGETIPPAARANNGAANFTLRTHASVSECMQEDPKIKLSPLCSQMR